VPAESKAWFDSLLFAAVNPTGEIIHVIPMGAYIVCPNRDLVKKVAVISWDGIGDNYYAFRVSREAFERAPLILPLNTPPFSSFLEALRYASIRMDTW
jgi:hypothetical protein